MAMYFGYEKSLRGWAPVVWHSGDPGNSTNGNGPDRIVVTPVPPELINKAGEPMFGKLQERFPLPEKKEEANE